ncbi:hypothetical protein PAPYR_11985 [Paratrimastix pyriformis]|uniref:Uncharacterized protein n=1 Tax=Paratrimastix pyriformis TaxID=342808 RepID=A0ABQ8U2P3_9EUKA|nr:hypothetical protein PAPYR_11985 [Paratrimastix pyriformis]
MTEETGWPANPRPDADPRHEGVDNLGVYGRSRELDRGAYMTWKLAILDLRKRRTSSLEHVSLILGTFVWTSCSSRPARWWPRPVVHTQFPSFQSKRISCGKEQRGVFPSVPKGYKTSETWCGDRHASMWDMKSVTSHRLASPIRNRELAVPLVRAQNR